VTTAIYPGSFDPITLGHVDILSRTSRLFDRVILAVVKNHSKKALIPLEKRVELVQSAIKHLSNVEVKSFEGLTVEFAKAHQAGVIVRGLRAVSDFEFEFSLSQMNRNLDPLTETMFMMAGLEFQFLSSSMVKEVASLGGDISNLVPEAVNTYLKNIEFKNQVYQDGQIA
jgi:pantetheine-phosphate adenylyltransferase